MATNAVVVSGTLPQSTSGTVDLTISGFGTVSAAVIFLTKANTTNNPQNDSAFCVAFWDGSNENSTANNLLDGLTTSIDTRSSSSTVIEYDALTYTVSNITDGIRITKTGGTTSVDRYVSAILISGATNSVIGNVSLSTLTVTETIGFKADLVFVMGIGGNAVSISSTYHGVHSFGVAHNDSFGTVTQGAVYGSSRDAQTTTVTNSRVTNSYVAAQLFNDTLSWQASLGNFTSTGFDITSTAATGGDYIFYLAIELSDPDDAYVGVIDAKTSTGTQAYTGTGFTPKVVGLVSEGSTAINTTAQSRAQSFGATDGTTHFCHFFHDEDAAGTSNAASEYSASNILHITDDAGTDDYIAALSSLDSDGFTLNYSDAAAAASKILAVAIGDSTAGGGGGTTVTKLAGQGGLAGMGGLAGRHGGLAG